MKSYEFKKCIIHDNVKCKNCVILLSSLLKDLFDESVAAQLIIYKCQSKSLRHIVYTNIFNRVVDLVFRMCYKCGELFHMLNIRHGVNEITIFDDVQGFCDIEQRLNESQHIKIYDIENNRFYQKGYYMRFIINDLRHYTEWCPESDQDELLQIEKYLATRYPDIYSFSMEHMFKYFKSNPTPKNPETIAKRKEDTRRLIQRIMLLQTTMTPLIESACIAFTSTILKNNKTMKGLHINVIPTDRDVDLRLIFSLFANEKVIYITPQTFKSKNIFILRNGDLYYPFLCKRCEMFVYFDVDEEILLQRIVKRIGRVNKQNLINSFAKLFNVCRIECGFGVLDVNSDYRYIIFENVKRLIVDQQIETTLPDYMCDNELIWIEDDDYMEQVPEWIGAFNSFSRIKIMM